MMSERALRRMVLSMDVVCDRSSNCDEPGARHDRWKPALGSATRHHLVEGGTGFTPQSSLVRIKVYDSVHPSGEQEGSFPVQTNVAVAAP